MYQIAVIGDSAGGGLALALLLKLRDSSLPLPAAAVVLSPWTDLALTGASLTLNAKFDAMVHAEDAPNFVADYLAGADPRHQARASSRSGGILLSQFKAVELFTDIAASGCLISCAIAAVATSTLKSRLARSRRASIVDSDRANEIVAGIRGLFKTTAPQRTMIEINHVVRQVLLMVENDLLVHGVTVSTEFQESLPPIMADRTQLHQVILNLVKNAIEAMAAGPTTKRTLRLVTAQDANSVVSLTVQDTGPGINPENGTHVFEAFFTTKSSGMGLGLSISRTIIEDHGGDLRLIKTSSNGCTFEITLPA